MNNFVTLVNDTINSQGISYTNPSVNLDLCFIVYKSTYSHNNLPSIIFRSSSHSMAEWVFLTEKDRDESYEEVLE